LDKKNVGLMLHLVSVMHSGILAIRGLQRNIGQEAAKIGQFSLSSMGGYVEAATQSGESIEGMKRQAESVNREIDTLIGQLSGEGDGGIIPSIPPELQTMTRQSDHNFSRIIDHHPDAFVETAQRFVGELLGATSVAGKQMLRGSRMDVADFGTKLDGIKVLYGETTSDIGHLDDFLITYHSLLNRFERAFGVSVDLIEAMPVRNLHLILDQLEPDALRVIRAQYRLARNKINTGQMNLGNLSKEKAIAQLDSVLKKIETAIGQKFTASGTTEALAGHRIPEEIV
jgi:hypothetical protein